MSLRAFRHPLLFILLLLVLLPASGTAQDRTDSDPLEGLNRKTHALNEGLDRYILRPVARGWQFITPDVLRRSLRNFDDNLRAPVILTNDILQWKWRAAGEQTARFAINSTVGLLGLFDPAAGWGLEKQNEDTGQTLGVWGIPAGPYIVLPLLGPSNPRDIVGLAGDSVLSIYWIFAPFYISTPYRAVDVVNRRALSDEDIQSARAAALDFYVFLRNAYAQSRDAQIRDMEESDSQEGLYDDDLYDIEDD